MSTIFSLPNELLVDIAAAGQEHRFGPVDSRLRSMASKPEWTISHVSRHLRDVVIGAPSLWTLVEASSHTAGSTKILKLYLERSCAGTLSLMLHVGYKFQKMVAPSDSIQNYALVKKQLSELDSHLTRTWRLRIVLWSRLLLPTLRDISARNLQHFEVVIKDRSDVTETELPAEIFSAGPPMKLKFLKISGLKLPLPVPQWTASLTHLELCGGPSRLSNLGTISAALTAQCPLLVHLHLDKLYTSSVTRLHVPSLKFLRISAADYEDEFYLLDKMGLFDTPALTEFIVDGAHGDQIFVLFNETSFPHTSFPALTSFSLVHSGSCTCETNVPLGNSISSPPLALFPALSSLTLINQCFTPKLVEDLLGPASHPWPQLQTVTLRPKGGNVDDVCSALRDAADAKRQRGQTLPKLRLSSELLSLEDWRERGVDVEKFDPNEVLDLFRT
ncbi:hypothetical protein DFH06DRAFT_1484174 [Mycena polygramma]|nr:hypothetical protein DFH06DRAFT_1484174 [Mycena polygramma]